MRKCLHILALILLMLLLLLCLHLSNRLPADRQPLVEKKYSAWSGVLRGWVCSRWSCEGSFTRWLNSCAADFERSHSGVYLEFTPVNEQALLELSATDASMRAPELILFSPGMLQEPSILQAIAPAAALKPGLSVATACPVAMGGYAVVRNTALEAAAPALLPDDAGRCFSLAAICFPNTEAAGEAPVPELTIDIGLPAAAIQQSQASLDAFTSGELSALLLSQKELSRLIALRDSGGGPDWSLTTPATHTLADQLLLAGVVQHSDAAAAARASLAAEFIQHLLADESQRKLSSIGAFPVTVSIAYSDLSPFAAIEQSLNTVSLAAPDYFSEYPPRHADTIVRDFQEGRNTLGDALRAALTESANNEPIYNR